jgi:hypothetical protein
MTTTYQPMTTCDECGGCISGDMDGAYDLLYGPYHYDGLERELRRLLREHPDWPPAQVLDFALAAWLTVEPVALVEAVKHRLVEEAA